MALTVLSAAIGSGKSFAGSSAFELLAGALLHTLAFFCLCCRFSRGVPSLGIPSSCGTLLFAGSIHLPQIFVGK